MGEQLDKLVRVMNGRVASAKWSMSETPPRFFIARSPVLVHTAIPAAIDMFPDFAKEVEKRGSAEEKYDDQ